MADRPNILLILTDEHAASVSGYAGDPVVQTQNLDRLAAEGMRFDAASCASPVCTPSRMSMLTGKEVHRCAGWANHWAIFPEHVTWPRHFTEHGYMTGLVGKMHYGGKDQLQGFQHRPYGDFRHGLGHQPEPLSMYPAYDNPESAGETEIPESLLQDVVVTRETLALLLEHHDRSPDVPWFVCASYCRPHSPLTAPGRYIRRYRDKVPPPASTSMPAALREPLTDRYIFDLTEEQTARGREGYYGCVDFVDDCIGDMIDGLEKAGALENTIVIYTSDHGEMAGHHGCWGKGIFYDPSTQVPMLVCGPGIEAGSSFEHPVSLMDLYPTTCGLAGLPVPEGLDGVDFSEALRNPDVADPPRTYAPSAYYLYGIRIRQGKAMDDAPSAAWRCVREKDWKYVEVERGETFLFDLENDPDETGNLAGDPGQAERCRTMKELLYRDFNWEDVHRQLEEDRERMKEFASGHPPGTPNQYRLPDGRIFDAEKSLYDARWLQISDTYSGGIIPQQFG